MKKVVTVTIEKAVKETTKEKVKAITKKVVNATAVEKKPTKLDTKPE